jgi:hypothetical protein
MRSTKVARRPAAGAVLGLLMALAVGACGSSSLSDTQLRTSAGRICTVADRRTARIPTPARPADGAAYLSRGLAALKSEVTQLRALHPPNDLAGDYRTGVDAAAAEVAALRSAVKGLKVGGDPVVEIKTLQHRLTPLEARADDAWRSVDVDACVNR